MSVAMSLRQRLIDEDPDFANDEALLRDVLDGETNVFDLIRRLGRFVLDAESLEAAAKKRAADITTRQRRFEAQANAARGALFGMLEALDERKFVDAEFTISLRSGRPSVMITDEESIPDEFWATTRSINKSAINAAIKDGKDVPGAVQTNSLPTLSLKAT